MGDYIKVDVKCSFTKMADVNTLVPHPMNPNKHGERQIEMLAKIIKYQGFRNPIVVSKRSGFIVAGHGRLMAAQKLGLTEVPVDEQDFKDEAAEFSHLIADNKIAELAEHDDNAMIDGIKTLGIEDFELLGLDGFELPVLVEAQCDEDDVPEAVEPRTKLGDVWRLGRHRLLCGDSTNVVAVDALMAGEKADMVFTDPPYGISLGHETKEQARARNRRTDGLKVANDDLHGDELEQFLTDALSSVDCVLVEGGAFYVCSPIDAEVRKFISAIEKVGWHYQSGLVWNKSSLSLSRHDYHPKHEIIHYGWKAGAAHKWVADRKQTTVFDFDKPSRSEHHPTTKPVELVEYYVSNVTNSGAKVVDVFGGSGSTLIACEKTNRKCFMMELDPHYCDVIVARWEKYTGKKAELVTPPPEEFSLAQTKHPQVGLQSQLEVR